MIEKIYTCKVCGKTFTFKDCCFMQYNFCICNSCNKNLSIPDFLDIIKEIENEQK